MERESDLVERDKRLLELRDQQIKEIRPREIEFSDQTNKRKKNRGKKQQRLNKQAEETHHHLTHHIYPVKGPCIIDAPLLQITICNINYIWK